jgi:chitodextrinase
MKNCTLSRRKWRAHATLFLLFSLSTFTGFSQLVAKGLTAATNKEYIGFYQYTPTDYDPNLKGGYPVIVFLHGIGERGNGTTDLSTVLNNGTPQKIKDGHPMRFFWNGKWETFLVLIPQLAPKYGWWQRFYIDEMIDYGTKNLNIDQNRIYLAGLSLGGGGVWDYAAGSLSNAQKFAALGISCGTCQSVDFCNLAKANLPVWAFHATDDGTVGVGCTTSTIAQLNNCKPAVAPYMTIWPTGQHWIWGRVFDTDYQADNPNIYEWFLGQNKSLPVNIRPTANAGNPQTITTGLGTVTLDASASTDKDGKLVRYIWTKVSGPNYGTINTPVSTDGKTTVTGLTSAGSYVYQVKAVDDRADYTLATVTITVNPGSGPDQAPTANAGKDINVYVPATTATLNGSASFDPEGPIASYTWSFVNGPTTAGVVTPNAVSTTVNNLVPGTYTFKLVVTDSKAQSGTTTIKVIVNAANLNAISKAGADVSITLPTDFTSLDGSASYDPDGAINKYEWTRLTGPTTYTIVSPTTAKTALTGLVQGTYTFQLKVYDNIWVPVNDTVKVTVNPSGAPPVNQAPVANAGAPINMTLPANSATLDGTGSTDPDGNSTIKTYAWTWVSGPAQYSLTNAGSASAGLSNLVAGTYTFKLVVTDNGGLSSNATVTVVVNPAANKPPVSNAGTAINITLPTNFTTLNGTGSSDPDGTITYAWSWVSGPTQYSIANAGTASASLTNLVAGTYTFKLVVTDNGGLSDNSTVTVTVNPAANKAPVANAGKDIVITLPTDNTTLDGSASTDADGKITGYSWVWLNGPTQYSLADASAATTALSNLVQGTYNFQLTVTDDGGLIHKATVKVTVNAAPPVNKIPVANAGTDIVLTLPSSSTTLDGSASKDADGNIAKWQWTKIGGPAQFNLAANNIASPGLSNLAEGTYAFELVVTDNSGATDKDTVNVIVNQPPPPANKLPVSVPGKDIVITLPTNTAQLDGSASNDPDGAIKAYEWTRLTGPTQFTLTDANAGATVLSDLVQGVYTFQLRVWDDAYASSVATIKVTVNPEPNYAPVADAGGDITITLPTNNTSLNGSGSTDPNGNSTISSYTWTWISGPAQYELANANAASTALNKLVAGKYAFRLQVTDNGGLSDADTVIVIVNAAPVPNQAPVANAGGNIALTLPANSTTLNGSGSTDPDGKSTITYSWTKIGGPAQYTITNAKDATANLSNLVEGVYTFVLTVTDTDGLSDADTLTVTVAPPPNILPVANAGADQSMSLPIPILQLNGTGSNDPDGQIEFYSWIKVSGPDGFTILNGNSNKPSLIGLTAGEYEFELTVTDNRGGKGTDLVKITVLSGPNKKPVANAGKDTIIAVPANSVTLNGLGSTDPDGTIVSYAWKQVGGYNVAIADATAGTTLVGGLKQVGKYYFELTVTDNKGTTATDTVLVTVVNNMRYKDNLTIYPNPAPVGTQVVVRCITDNLGKATITVMDQFGRPVEIKKVVKTEPYQEFPLAVSHLKPGNYYIEVQIERKQRMITKFIKR